MGTWPRAWRPISAEEEAPETSGWCETMAWVSRWWEERFQPGAVKPSLFACDLRLPRIDTRKRAGGGGQKGLINPHSSPRSSSLVSSPASPPAQPPPHPRLASDEHFPHPRLVAREHTPIRLQTWVLRGRRTGKGFLCVGVRKEGQRCVRVSEERGNQLDEREEKETHASSVGCCSGVGA